MEIYISRNGERYGPFGLDEVQADINAGNIQPSDLAWHEGISDWAEVWQIEGITLPKRRVPPPPPPLPAPRVAANSSALPQSDGNSGEMALLIILTLLIPLAGIIIGLIRISNPRKRSEGMTLVAISIAVSVFYVIFFSQR